MILLPADFVESMQSILGSAYADFDHALQQPPIQSLRMHPDKIAQSPTHLDRVPWATGGYYLPDRCHFTYDPLFHAGGYYVQEASSMCIEQAIRQVVDRPIRMLDLCAAPGGKSTHSISLLPEGSLLVSNELIRARSYVLAENMAKWGFSNSIVTRNEPSDFSGLTHYFDLILADVPCSGEGMFRKDPASIEQWSVANVKLCAERQRAIIESVWPSLAPGGFLIYSTCTYNREENEDNVSWIMEQYGASLTPIALEPAWGITAYPMAQSEVYHFYPHKSRGEGFFLALLRKPDGDRQLLSRPRSMKSRPVAALDPKIDSAIKQAVLGYEDAIFELYGQILICYSNRLKEDLNIIGDKLFVLSKGLAVATLKAGQLIPTTTLALSRALDKGYFYTYEVGYKQAIQYLRRESMILPVEIPRGWVLIQYQGLPLGFVKQLSGRANNLFEENWRIRSGYNPTDLILPLAHPQATI